MYKTIWFIDDGEFKTKFTQYHFNKEPRFPAWYMEEGKVYTIELMWNLKLLNTLELFLKCLFKHYKIEGIDK